MSKVTRTIFGGSGQKGILGTGTFAPRNINVREFSREGLEGRGSQALTRRDQTALQSRLEAAERGEGPSIVREQLQEATERNLAEAQAQAASTRGIGGALAAREAGRTRARASQESARQSAVLKAQEQVQARGELGGLLQQIRGQDIQTQVADLQAKQAEEQLRVQAQLGTQAAKQQAFQSSAAARRGLIQSGIAGVGKLFSDKNLKEDIKDISDKDMSSFLSALKGKKFKFKDEELSDSETGIIAQDLEKTKLGKELVSEDEEGRKQVDLSKAIQTQLAATGFLANKLDKITKNDNNESNSEKSEGE